MNKDIYNIKLLDLLPDNLRKDPDIIVASQAVDKEFQLMAQNITNCLTFADIDNASPEVLDHLAVEMNTDFYSQDLSIEKRRALVKNSYNYHFLKGTKHVVEQLVTDAFDDSSLEEWFDYGGQPYYFKVTTTDRITDISVLSELIKAIEAVKNVRSWLENINIYRQNEAKVYYGVANRQAKRQSIKQIKYIGPIVSLMGVSYEIINGGV